MLILAKCYHHENITTFYLVSYVLPKIGQGKYWLMIKPTNSVAKGLIVSNRFIFTYGLEAFSRIKVEVLEIVNIVCLTMAWFTFQNMKSCQYIGKVNL